eukprot:SAG25_NODE_2226_length_1822_cov_1.362739_2_plen_239_part_00
MRASHQQIEERSSSSAAAVSSALQGRVAIFWAHGPPYCTFHLRVGFSRATVPQHASALMRDEPSSERWHLPPTWPPPPTTPPSLPPLPTTAVIAMHHPVVAAELGREYRPPMSLPPPQCHPPPPPPPPMPNGHSLAAAPPFPFLPWGLGWAWALPYRVAALAVAVGGAAFAVGEGGEAEAPRGLVRHPRQSCPPTRCHRRLRMCPPAPTQRSGVAEEGGSEEQAGLGLGWRQVPALGG